MLISINKKLQDVSDSLEVKAAEILGQGRTALYVMASDLTDYEFHHMFYGYDDPDDSRCSPADAEHTRDFGHIEGDFEGLKEKLEIVQLPRSDNKSFNIKHTFPSRALVCGRRVYCKLQMVPWQRLVWSTTDVLRWLYAMEVLLKKGLILLERDLNAPRSQRYVCLDKLSLPKSTSSKYYNGRWREMVSSHASNVNFPLEFAWYIFIGRHESPENDMWQKQPWLWKPLLILLTSLSMVYGGIHLSAWNFDFPSELELLLWRIAAFSIMAGFPAFILSSYLLLRIR